MRSRKLSRKVRGRPPRDGIGAMHDARLQAFKPRPVCKKFQVWMRFQGPPRRGRNRCGKRRGNFGHSIGHTIRTRTVRLRPFKALRDRGLMRVAPAASQPRGCRESLAIRVACSFHVAGRRARRYRAAGTAVRVNSTLDSTQDSTLDATHDLDPRPRPRPRPTSWAHDLDPRTRPMNLKESHHA